MSLIQVLGDLGLEFLRQIQVKHGCVGQIKFLGQFGRLSIQFFHIASHVTDDEGVENRAKGAQYDGNQELTITSSWYNLTDTKDEEARIQQHEILMPESFISFKETLVGLRLSYVHEVHVLYPAFGIRHDSEPDTGKYVNEDEQEESHHDNFQVDLDILGHV